MQSDLPLVDSTKDKLGRILFATEIASGLVNSFKENNDSIVLGINGTWGSGKSTLINFIVNEIENISKEQNQEIITLRFNPWMFSGQKELQNIFLKELFLKLESNKEKLKDASKKIADFLGHLNWLKYVHSGTGEAINDAKSFLEGINKEKDLVQLKADIDELLIESKIKLYITIDDIDRLTPSEITDIFQLVKLNGNFANTIFILAYDQDVVTKALNFQFGDNGKKYIEKIVQVDYTLPSISKENISRVFIDSLTKLFGDSPITNILTEISDNLKDEPFLNFFTSLRDIYRFNNSIKLRLPSIFKEVNILDFFKIEAIRIFEPDAYQFIIDSKQKLTFEQTEQSHNLGVNNENDTSKLVQNTSFSDLVKGILDSLFVIDNSFVFNSLKPNDLIREKKVADKNYFDRYFNLQLSSYDIKEETFEKFIQNSSIEEKIEILNYILSEKQLFQFLNWIEIKSKNGSIEQLKEILISCFKFTESIDFKKMSFWGYDNDFTFVQWFCSKFLDNLQELDDRRDVISKYKSLYNKEFSFSLFINLDSIIYAKRKLEEDKLLHNHMWNSLFSREKGNDDNFINDVEITHKKASKFLFEKELKNRNSLNEDELTSLMQTVSYQHKSLYNKNFPKLIENDNDLVKYLWLVIRRSYMTSGNQTGYQLAEYQFFPCMDKEDIKKRLDKLDTEKFDSDENKIITIFLKAYENGFKEKEYFNIENTELMEQY